MLTDLQLDALWLRAGRAQDYTMCTFAERALDGDDAARQVCTSGAQSVAIYAEAVREVRGAG